MRNSYWKDIWRTVKKEKKRFISIAVIAALGVTMMCGLRASCVDLRYSADTFFDEQKLFDIRVVSTLGISESDLEALENVNGVAEVDGGYNETVYFLYDGVRKSMEVRTLSENDFNMPYLSEGKLPEKENEIVVTKKYQLETEKGIGDEISLDEEPDNLKSSTYIITGIIVDPMDINSTEGSMAFRSTATTDYVGYVIPEASDSDIYTTAYLMVEGSEELNCYTEEYEKKIESVVSTIEKEIKVQREQARYEEVYNDAMEEWLDGKQEMEEEFAKADKEIDDAEDELKDGRKELEDGRKELSDGRKELEDARKDISSGWKEISDGRKELEEGREELERQEADARKRFADAREEIETGYEELEAGEAELAAAYQQLSAGQAELDKKKAEVETMEEQLGMTLEDARAELAAYQAELDAGMAQYEAGMQEIEKGKKELAKGEQELDRQEEQAFAQIESAYEELEKAEAELKEGERKLAEGERELAEGERELVKGEQELKDGEAELEEGEQELNDAKAEYEEEKADAIKELNEAKEEIDEIDVTKWYVQDRNALSGFSNVKSDASSIQAIGDVFPVLFLTIAILISLTTITRMVDEERGLVGTYQALGFMNQEIRRKYVIFAASSCLIGGIIGDIGGYVILPKFLFTVFHIMYLIPDYSMHFDALFGVGGIILFEAGILGATVYAIERKLKHMPAKLMRPKAPKDGSRVLLERIGFVWKRLSFLNKVTARNLFRYKKRMFMTIFGIMGCTALLLCGFTIKNTVSAMIPQQYDNIYKYDLMAVSMDDDYEELAAKMENDTEIDAYIPARIESVEIFNAEGAKTQIQLIVVENGEDLKPYIHLKNKKNDEYVLEEDEIFLTRNATRILGLSEGEEIIWQNQDLVEAKKPFTRMVENYLGNAAYMTVSIYEEMFGEYVENGVLANFTEECKDQAAYTDNLAREDGILSAISTEQMAAEFEPAFALINMVVYIVLILAAMLAFVVLFTLSNTNISERERELATIKVLGFYNAEVHSYVNKETIILTGLGIIFGMPAGWLLGRYVMGILEFPSLEFYISLYPVSYVIAAIITVVFAVAVNLITDRSLDQIDMIEALKSVE